MNALKIDLAVAPVFMTCIYWFLKKQSMFLNVHPSAATTSEIRNTTSLTRLSCLHRKMPFVTDREPPLNYEDMPIPGPFSAFCSTKCHLRSNDRLPHNILGVKAQVMHSCPRCTL
jgi:hypothetical protein